MYWCLKLNVPMGIDKCLQMLDADTAREISFRLQSIYRMPGRVITRARTEPDYLYIIRFGQISVQVGGLESEPSACLSFFSSPPPLSPSLASPSCRPERDVNEADTHSTTRAGASTR